MGAPAYLAKVYTSGTPTETILEFSAYSGSSHVFEISSASQKRISRDHPVTVYVDGVVVDPSEYSLSYLTGRLTFLEYEPVGDVTADGYFIPVLEVAGASNYSLNIEGDILNDDNFKDCRVGGFHRKMYGMLDITATLEVKWKADSTKFSDEKLSRAPLLVEIFPGGGPTGFIGWFVVETDGLSGEVSGLENDTISLKLDGDASSSFDVIYDTSLSDAIMAYGMPLPGQNGLYMKYGVSAGRGTYQKIGDNTESFFWNGAAWVMQSYNPLTFHARSRAPHGATLDLVAQWETMAGVLIPNMAIELYHP